MSTVDNEFNFAGLTTNSSLLIDNNNRSSDSSKKLKKHEKKPQVQAEKVFKNNSASLKKQAKPVTGAKSLSDHVKIANEKHKISLGKIDVNLDELDAALDEFDKEFDSFPTQATQTPTSTACKTQVFYDDRFIVEVEVAKAPQYKQPLQLDFKKAKAWISRFNYSDKEALNILINNIKGISHENFLEHLKISTDRFLNKANKNELYTILVEPNKSNKWVADLSHKKIQETGLKTIQVRLGASHASEFIEYLKQSPIVIPDHLVLFDDASYSGTQMSSHVNEIFKLMYEQGKDLKTVHLHVIIPFMTEIAKQLLEEQYDKWESSKHIHASQKIATVYQVLMKNPHPKRNIEIIEKLFWKSEIGQAPSKKRGLTYFNHKVPNFMSFPEMIAHGRVFKSKEEFEILPAITSPY